MEQNNKRRRSKLWNKQYAIISLYSLGVIAIGGIILRVIFHFADAINVVARFLDIISPFLIGLLIAYMINPFINLFYYSFFQRKLHIKRKRTFKLISIVISYLIILGILTCTLTIVIPQLVESLTELTMMIPDLYENIMDKLTNLTKHGQNMATPTTLNVLLNQNMPKLYGYVEEFMGKSIPMLYDWSLQALKLLVNLLIALIISVYMSMDKKILLGAARKFFYASMPVGKARNFMVTLRECNQIFSKYLSGKAIDSLIIGILSMIIMTILDLPLALLVSLIVGITNMIPYFGPFIGAVPGIFLIAIINPYAAIKFLIMVFLLQQFDGYILGPKILGNSTGVRPIGILFAIIVGGAYFGAVGMFLGVPVFAVIQHLVGKWMEEKLKKKNVNFSEL